MVRRNEVLTSTAAHALGFANVNRLRVFLKEKNIDLRGSRNETLQQFQHRVQQSREGVYDVKQVRKALAKDRKSSLGNLPTAAADVTHNQVPREERQSRHQQLRRQRSTFERDRHRTETTALGGRFHVIRYDGDFGINRVLGTVGSRGDADFGMSGLMTALLTGATGRNLGQWRFVASMRTAFENIFTLVEVELKKKLRQRGGGNLLASIAVEVGLIRASTEEELTPHHFNSTVAMPLTSEAALRSWVLEQMERCIVNIENLVNRGSDIGFDKVNFVEIKTQSTRRNRGGSFIETPAGLRNRRATLNIKNVDDRCFEYCLAAFLHDGESSHKDKSNPRLYERYMADLQRPSDVQYPVAVDVIGQYEDLHNLKIVVWAYDNLQCEGYPAVLYDCRTERPRVCHVLLIRGSEDRQHYLLIKNINALMKDKSAKNKEHMCEHCLNKRFRSLDDLAKHKETCLKGDEVRVVMPEEENATIEFRNHGHKFHHPFSVFIDFESTLHTVVDDQEKNTQKTQQHIPNSCGIKYTCIHNEFSEPLKLFNNADPEELMREVIEYLDVLGKKSYDLLQQNKGRQERLQCDWRKYNSCSTCANCSCKFGEDDNSKKVWHHDHISGGYISALCNKCNQQMRYLKVLPIYAHNLKSYDAHFIIPALSKYGCEDTPLVDLNCIPQNEEKFISFTKVIKVGEYRDKDNKVKPATFELRFLDTMAFMATSLDALVKNLGSGCQSVSELRTRFPNTSEQFSNDDEFVMMTKKGIYPYEHITSYDNLLAEKLPPRSEFYNKLAQKECSKDEYRQAEAVFRQFKCQSFLEYHNLYLTADVLLLSDIWSNFVSTCMRIYQLDPHYYYTAPGLSWDAFLYHANAESMRKTAQPFKLELLLIQEMYEMFEKSIRGGLSQISTRYAQANNPQMETYDPAQSLSYLLYLDANNLYGYAMCQFLPKSAFKWNTETWIKERILALNDVAEMGYLFEVDLHYPLSLHDLHNGYALAPENIQVKNHMLNEWQTKVQIRDGKGWRYEERKDNGVKKLCTTFYDKEKYVVNYRTLKLYLQLGLELKHVHRVIEFEQSDFMNSYIMKNTEERKNAKNDFEKDFYKLMNNSVFGKTMENVRNRINYKLVVTQEKAEKKV
jgi:hypothetical protein